MLRRDIEAEILPTCAARGIGVLAYSPMAFGLLTGTWTKARHDGLPDDDSRKSKNPLFQEPRFSRNLEVVEVLRGIAATCWSGDWRRSVLGGDRRRQQAGAAVSYL